MKLSRLIPICLVLAATTACQRGVTLETRTFEIQNLYPEDAQELVRPYVFDDRAEAPGTMSAIEGALTVRETADNLEKIARVLAEFDAPRGDARLHFQLIEAGSFRASDERIAGVEEELRRLFQHDGYRLIGETYVTAADKSNILQTMSRDGSFFQLGGTTYWAAAGTIRLDGVTLEGPGVGFSTTVNIRLGQTIVLGSASNGSAGTTLFLVVTALENG